MNRRIIIGIVIIILVIIGVAVYRSQQGPAEGEQLTDAEVQDILASVGRHIKLPEGEQPLIATVADVDLLLQREPFYTGASNGDILLLYPNAGKAILYAPDEDLIVNVGPIILDQNAQGQVSGEATGDAAAGDTVLTDEEGGDASADDIPDEVQ